MALNLLDQIEQSFNNRPIGIEEFAESDQFCNKLLYPRQLLLLKLFFLEELTGKEEDTLDYWIGGGRNGDEIQMSPNIRERMDYLRSNGYSHFPEIVLVGGRRSSKGFMTGLSMAKIMYDTLQLQDPGAHFGIDKTKEIQFSCVAGSESQAKDFQYADFVSTVETCKAFDPYLHKTLETEFKVATQADLRRMAQSKAKGGKIQRDTAKLRGKALAANAGTLRGSATMAICIDEMAWMIAGETKASADQVYKAAQPSLDQFGKAGITFCNSSPASKVGMFYERYQEAMKPYDSTREIGGESDEDNDNGSPLNFTFQYPSWALFEGYRESKHFPKRITHAITVSADWNPREQDEHGEDIHAEEDKASIIKAKTQEASNPETYKVERRGKFAEVTDAYLNPDMVDRIFMGVPFGFNPDGSELLKPIPLNYGFGATNLHSYVCHLDPSSTTAGFGFALGHAEDFEDKFGRVRKHVVFDIVKRWNPNDFPGKTIDWETVIEEVMHYIDLFRPFEVSLDQYQSHAPIQRLRQMCQDAGIGAVYINEDFATGEKNWNRAEIFKTAINHGLVHAPLTTEHDDVELVSQELKFLQKKNTGGKYPRVDKQDIGPVRTKDMADCMMEVVQSLIGNVMAQEARERAASVVMSAGSAGGYQIGGRTTGIGPLARASSDFASAAGALYGSRKGEQRIPGHEHNNRPGRASIGGMGKGRRGMGMGRGRGRR